MSPLAFYRNIRWLIAAAWLTSCLPDPLEVNGLPDPPQTVVVASQNVPGEFITVGLTRTFGALQGGRDSDFEALLNDILVDGISVHIGVNGRDYLLENPSPGIYTSSDVPIIPMADYRLHFDNPFNGQPVSSTARLLPYVGFDTLIATLDISEFDTLIHLDYQINDPLESNWYYISVTAFKDILSLSDRPFVKLFTDTTFNGQIHRENFTVPFQDYSPGDTVIITMANISDKYYDFLTLRNDQRFNPIGALGEPVTYPSNVENGLGFFNTQTTDIRILTVE